MIITTKQLISFYKKYLKKNLSEKRFHHSICVAQEAKKLAKINNFENLEKAYLAGLVHDICKELSKADQKELVLSCKSEVDEYEFIAYPLYHAIAGSVFIEKGDLSGYNITDADIINAVRYHTVARKAMSTLEKIIYLADLVSHDREYKDVKKYRRFAHKSLDLGMKEALRFSISQDLIKENYIIKSTYEAYNEYIKKENKNNDQWRKNWANSKNARRKKSRGYPSNRNKRFDNYCWLFYNS